MDTVEAVLILQLVRGTRASETQHIISLRKNRKRKPKGRKQ
jgi:hypothetical protein